MAEDRVVRAPRNPCSSWTGIVPPGPSYPQRISLWTTCANSVDCCAQLAPNGVMQGAQNGRFLLYNKGLTRLARRRRAARGIPGLPTDRCGQWPQGCRLELPLSLAECVGFLDTSAENRLNGGFCDAAGDHTCRMSRSRGDHAPCQFPRCWSARIETSSAVNSISASRLSWCPCASAQV